MPVCVLFIILFGKECFGTAVMTKTPTGFIEGFVRQVKHGEKLLEVTAYLGIPYAEPPTGELRFAKPLKKGYFEQPFKANERKPACIEIFPAMQTSEDCLNLNIIVPRSNKSPPATDSLAVMVYIYGGWWQHGHKDNLYSPEFAASNDVILVTLNYRMNAYGFLAHDDYGIKGNYGLWDQQTAIQWVHDNIEAFGGDKNRITLVGHSAGAASVLFQLLYQGNKGLFQGVIAQSGSPVAPWAHNRNYKATFMDFVKRCGCDSYGWTDTVECLRKLNTSEINMLYPDRYLITSKLHLPVYDGDFITFSPKDFNLKYEENREFFDRLSSVNLIIGLTSSDGSWNYRRWSYHIQELGGSFETGITESEFRVLSTYLDNILDLNFTVLEKNAIIHQYIDWSDSNNSTKNRDAFLDLSKDLEFTSSIYKVAAARAQADGRGHTFVYEFDHKPSFSDLPEYIKGPIHHDELPYVFGFPKAIFKRWGIIVEDPSLLVTREELELSSRIQTLWATFAKTSEAGNLSAVLSLPWPKYTVSEGKYLQISSDGNEIKRFYRGSAVHFWNVLMPELQEAGTQSKYCVMSGEPVLKPLATFTLLLLCLDLILTIE